MRRATLLLAAVSCLAAGPTLRYASASRRPAWISHPPAADQRFIYVVGIKTGAPTLEEGKRAAAQNLAAQIVDYMGVRMTARYESSRSELAARVLDEIKAYGAGTVPSTVLQEMFYQEWETPVGRSVDVYLLGATSRDQVEHERKRMREAVGDYRETLNQAAHEIGQRVKAAGGGGVVVAGFHDLLTRKRMLLCRVLESDFETALAEHGLSLMPSASAAWTLTGTHHLAGDQVLVSLRLVRRATEASVYARTVGLPLDALDPDWLQAADPHPHPSREADGGRSAGAEAGPPAAPPGTLGVMSDPSGARIFLDGEDRGVAPVDLHEVPAGMHGLMLVLPGYRAYSAAVDVAPDHPTEVRAALVPKQGTLVIRSQPPGARVALNDIPMGATPAVIENLQVGWYTLTASSDGFKDQREDVEIQEGSTTVRLIRLVEEDGALLVISEPPGGRVYLDGEYRGEAKPLALSRVGAGLHRLRVAATGAGEWEGHVTVRSRWSETVTAHLRPRTEAPEMRAAAALAGLYEQAEEAFAKARAAVDAPPRPDVTPEALRQAAGLMVRAESALYPERRTENRPSISEETLRQVIDLAGQAMGALQAAPVLPGTRSPLRLHRWSLSSYSDPTRRESGGMLNLTVLNASDRTPVRGAEVVLVPGESAPADFSRTDRKYRVEYLPAGGWVTLAFPFRWRGTETAPDTLAFHLDVLHEGGTYVLEPK